MDPLKVEPLGRWTLFIVSAISWMVRPPFRSRLFFQQFYQIGNRSLLIIGLTAVFSGMVFAIQFYFGFRMLSADALVGPATALSFTRELGPVFTAIIVAGRSGSAIAANLGTMRITEQIDALEVMAVNPIQYLVSPRILAATLSVPVLSLIFLLIGNLGSYLTGVYLLEIDPVVFFSHLDEFVHTVDLIQGLIKSALFGFFISSIATFQGFTVRGGAAAVSEATTRSVVISIVVILIGDYFLTVMIRTLLYGQGGSG